MKMLITGACGFLGYWLNDYLFRNGESYFHGWKQFSTCRQDTDLVDRGDVRQLLGDIQPDIIFHCAGRATAVSSWESLFASNCQATANLLHEMPAGCFFTYISSATVYGDQAVPASGFHETGETQPKSDYAVTKELGETFVRLLCQRKNSSYAIIRPTTICGPRASHGLIPDLVAKLYDKTPTLNLLGDRPGSAKSFISVHDAVEMIARLSAMKMVGVVSTSHNVFNIGGDRAVSVEQVANIAMDVTGIHKPIRWLGENANWPGDLRQLFTDCSRANRLTGKQPSSEKAIHDAIRGITMEVN